MLPGQDDVKKLIIAKNRRLQLLKEREARMGSSTDPSILIEIEYLEAEISEIQRELNREEQYNLQAIHELLLEAFSSEELEKLLFENSNFRRFVKRIDFSGSKAFVIDQIISLSERQLLIPDLLMTIREYNPRQYFRFEEAIYSREITESSTEHTGTITSSSSIIRNIEPLEDPYVVGNPVQPEHMSVFLGRFDIAKSIISELRKKGQKPSMLLYGRRRMGKTSALLNISHLVRDPDLLVVYISGQSAKFHTNVNFCFYLVCEIVNKLQQADIDIKQFRTGGFLQKENYLENPVLTFSEFFDDCNEVLLENNKYCLLSIDEYEEIDQHINIQPENHHNDCISRELLLELRDILQHKPRFMFLFAGIHYLRDLAKVNWSEIFINVKTIHISFLDRIDGRRLLTEPVPELKYQNEKLIDEILDLTGCQPFLLQAIASELISHLNSNDSRIVTPEILDEAIHTTLDKHSTYFDYIWDTECENLIQQDILIKVSLKENGIAEKEYESHQGELRSLIRREVLKAEEGRIKLTMPIVKFWLRENHHIL